MLALIYLILLSALLPLFARMFLRAERPWRRALVDALPVLWLFAAALAITRSTANVLELPRFDLYLLAVAVSTSALAALPAALSPPRWRPGVACGVALSLTGLAAADCVYYRYYGGLIPMNAWSSSGQLWDIRTSVAALVEPRDALWTMVLVSAALLLAAWPRDDARTVRFRGPQLVAQLTLVLVCISTAAPATIGIKHWLDTRYSWKVFRADRELYHANFMLVHMKDLARMVRESLLRPGVADGDLDRVQAYFGVRENTRSAPGYGHARGANVIMIQVEALQAWAVDARVDGEPLMPFLRELPALRYDGIYDQTGGSPTSDCEYAVLNSLHPLSQGSVAFRRPGNHFRTLTHVLAESGYGTLVAHAYDRAMWNRSVVHPRWGFEALYYRQELGHGRRVGLGLADDEFFKRVLPILERQPDPFLAYLITLTSHHPYTDLPEDFRVFDLGKMESTELGSYLQSIRYVDQALAGFVGALDGAGLLDRSMLVIFGDHDAKLRLTEAHVAWAVEHLDLGSTRVRRIADRHLAADRIPLLIRLPKASKRGRVATVGGQIDIAPTALHWLGVDAPRSFIGRPLLAGRPGRVVTLDGSAVQGRWASVRGQPNPGCYRLPEWRPTVTRACAKLVAESEEHLRLSTLVTLEDLVPQILEARH